MMRSILVALLAANAAAFLPSSHLPAVRQSPPRHQMVAQMDQTGLHGTGSRFMPIVQIGPKEHYPRSVCIAGEYPGLTAEDIAAPTSSAPGDVGSWQYDFTDPEGPQLGTVALPASDALADLVDPVVIVAGSDALGIPLPQEAVTEVLVVVDREELEFEVGKFFVWQAPDGSITIRWFDRKPQDHTCLGRVMMVHVPFLEVMKGQSSGWMEEEEEYYT